MSSPFRTRLAAIFFSWVSSAVGAPVENSEPLSGEVQSGRRPPLEIATLRMQYGFSFHRGSQADVGPGLSFNGTTGNDLALWASAYPTKVIGASLALQREGFVLYDDQRKVTDSTLYRASIGPSARFNFGNLSSQTAIAYAYAQLPSFGATSQPQFSSGRRHSLMLGEVIGYRLPFNSKLEARGEFPITLSASDGSATNAKSSGILAGATLGVELGRWRTISYGLAADYQFIWDRLESTNGTKVAQSISRVGLSVQFAWAPVEPRVLYASLPVLVREGSLPLAGVPVEISTATRTMEVVTGQDGRAVAPGVPYGEATVRVHLSGYSPVETHASVSSAQHAEVALSLEAIKKTSGLLISIIEADNGLPVDRATVSVRGEEYATDDQGLVSLTDLPLGLIEVTASKSGFQPTQEIASVVAGKKSPLTIRLNREAKRARASISGIVRSDAGHPLAATLEILNFKTLKANARGQFRLQIKPGTYPITISAPGFLSQNKTITVKDGEETILDVDLHPLHR